MRVTVKFEDVDDGARRTLRGNHSLPKRQVSLAELPRISDPSPRRRGSTGNNSLYGPYAHPLLAPIPQLPMQPHSHSTLPPLSANTPAVPTPRYRPLQPSAIDYNQYDPHPVQWHNPYPKYQNSYPQFINPPYTMEPASTFDPMYTLGHVVDPGMEPQSRFIQYEPTSYDPPSPCDTMDSTLSTRTDDYDDRSRPQSSQFDELAHQQYLQQFIQSPLCLLAPRPVYGNYGWPQLAVSC